MKIVMIGLLAITLALQELPEVREPAAPESALHGPRAGPEPCPEAEGDEIVICAPEVDSRYRIPKRLRGRAIINSRGDLSVIQERMRWVEGDPMDFMGYCTAVGPNGWQGCMFEEWKDQRQEKGLAY